MEIRFLSAADRFNYGDLLFPIVFSKLLSDSYKIENYGLVASDFSKVGALPTRSYRSLLRHSDCSPGLVVVGGGEVIGASWSQLYGFINPIYASAMNSYKIKQLESKVGLAKYFMSKGRVSLPFQPHKEEFKAPNKIVCSSVGGVIPDEPSRKFQAVSSLTGYDYISVRDARAEKSLIAHGIDCKLVPDSACLMSDYFPLEHLTKIYAPEDGVLPDRYIFLQLGLHKRPNDLRLFASEITKISKKLDAGVVLCPIGLAPNHSDDIVLKQLSEYSSVFTYWQPKHIFEIMYLIASSELYIGTSLHGLITAHSFCVPFAPVNPEISKLESYVSTWFSEFGCKVYRYDELVDTVDAVMQFENDRMEKNLAHHKKLVRNNLRNIAAYSV